MWLLFGIGRCRQEKNGVNRAMDPQARQAEIRRMQHRHVWWMRVREASALPLSLREQIELVAAS